MCCCDDSNSELYKRLDLIERRLGITPETAAFVELQQKLEGMKAQDLLWYDSYQKSARFVAKIGKLLGVKGFCTNEKIEKAINRLKKPSSPPK
jgi:hypothetical protein